MGPSACADACATGQCTSGRISPRRGQRTRTRTRTPGRASAHGRGGRALTHTHGQTRTHAHAHHGRASPGRRRRVRGPSRQARYATGSTCVCVCSYSPVWRTFPVSRLPATVSTHTHTHTLHTRVSVVYLQHDKGNFRVEILIGLAKSCQIANIPTRKCEHRHFSHFPPNASDGSVAKCLGHRVELSL
jgi:hypothetical protein